MADSGNLVTIRDIDVPFWRIVLILIKWSIAAIIIGLLYAALFAVLGGAFVGVMGMFGVPMPELPTPPTP